MKKYFHFFLIPVLAFMSCQESFDKRLMREAQEFTQRHCPQNEDNITRLDSMTYSAENKTLTQWRTIYGEDSKEQIQLLLKHQNVLKEHLLKALLKDTRWKSCMEEDITFLYTYSTEGGEQPTLFIRLTKTDYSSQKAF